MHYGYYCHGTRRLGMCCFGLETSSLRSQCRPGLESGQLEDSELKIQNATELVAHQMHSHLSRQVRRDCDRQQTSESWLAIRSGGLSDGEPRPPPGGPPEDGNPSGVCLCMHFVLLIMIGPATISNSHLVQD